MRIPIRLPQKKRQDTFELSKYSIQAFSESLKVTRAVSTTLHDVALFLTCNLGMHSSSLIRCVMKLISLFRISVPLDFLHNIHVVDVSLSGVAFESILFHPELIVGVHVYFPSNCNALRCTRK